MEYTWSSLATVMCPACGGATAAHLDRCIHCAAPRSVDRPGPAPSAPPVAAPPAPPPAPSKPECPICGADPGPGKIRVESREYVGSTWNFRRRYKVRGTDAPGICARCNRTLEIQRFIADAVSMAPFVLFFIGLLVTDSKVFLGLLAVYALVLFKWSWGLGYVWADALVYGNRLESSLSRFIPPGDSGTARFPAGIGHCLLRIVGLPALVVVVALGVDVVRMVPGKGAQPTAPAVILPEGATPVEQARILFGSTTEIAVPVHPGTLEMKRLDVKREDIYFFTVYALPATLPAGMHYQKMTGPQFIAKFRQTPGNPSDMVYVRGACSIAVYRDQIEEAASTLPTAEAPTSPALQSTESQSSSQR